MPPQRIPWVIVGTALAVLIVVGSFGWQLPPASRSPSSPAKFPVVPISLEGANGSAISLEAGFLGVNLRADEPFASSDGAHLNATGVRLVRYPGGGDGDRFDPLAGDDQGAVYNDAGQATIAKTSLSTFVTWCVSVSCASIITLPAEIDNASTALSIVNYTEGTLGFHPTYWEIGNEPSLWDHFGIPWGEWNVSQNDTPTPGAYAKVVQTYVRAIRSVDPTTGIVGIGGIGKGASEVSEWFTPTIELNGPNLSAMAIHVYPAGSGFPSGNLSAWFGSLWGTTGLPSRVASAESVMETDCPQCHLSLLVDEFQTGTGLSPATALSGGYFATYLATELVQALPLPVTSMDYYVFEADSEGAWFNSTGASSSAYSLYLGLRTYLGPWAVQMEVGPSVRGVVAAEGGSSSGSMTSLLLANANSTTGVEVNLTSIYPDAAQGDAWTFDGSSSQPSEAALGAAGAEDWVVPPASLVIFNGLGLSV